MSFFDYMFDFKSGANNYIEYNHEQKQQGEIASLSNNISWTDSKLRAQEARIDRIELISKTLLEFIVTRHLATHEELQVLMQQIDLEDGVEDGKISTKIRQSAPTCTSCGRFVNPKRDACVYCGATIEVAQSTKKSPAKAAPVRLVECSQCGKQIPERESYFTENGLSCASCYKVVL